MAKQANIQGAIDKLRTSNEKTFGEINDRSGEIAFNTRTTKNLIGDMLDGMARSIVKEVKTKKRPYHQQAVVVVVLRKVRTLVADLVSQECWRDSLVQAPWFRKGFYKCVY